MRLKHDVRWRPYRAEYTGSLPNSEVNRRRARSVLNWGTVREHPWVPLAFFRFIFRSSDGRKKSICHLFRNFRTDEPWSMVFACSPQRGARERSSYWKVVMDFCCKPLRIERLSIRNGLMSAALLQCSSQSNWRYGREIKWLWHNMSCSLGQVLV